MSYELLAVGNEQWAVSSRQLAMAMSNEQWAISSG